MSRNPDEGLVFVDTNILVYAHDASEEEKQTIAKALIDELWESEQGALSTQVLQEFYVVATRKFEPPLSRKEARELVSNYGEWKLVRIEGDDRERFRIGGEAPARVLGRLDYRGRTSVRRNALGL